MNCFAFPPVCEAEFPMSRRDEEIGGNSRVPPPLRFGEMLPRSISPLPLPYRKTLASSSYFLLKRIEKKKIAPSTSTKIGPGES